ncbi:MAG: phosphotransferase [Chlorobiales bacterium]|nr:phosphotransferase [Chlorobiales bacterium]
MGSAFETDQWLFCDFHIHTSWSDGALSPKEVVDLYGQHGFDVIAITDHVVGPADYEDYTAAGLESYVLTETQFPEYIETLIGEAKRAWEKYNMILIPGAEFTSNRRGFHLLGVDIRQFIDSGLPAEEIATKIHEQGGLAIAAHPCRGVTEGVGELGHLWKNRKKLVTLIDAWEIGNRRELYPAVAEEKLRYVANSDFHDHRHLYTWKTMLGCEKNIEAIKAEIRSNKRVAIRLFKEQRAD